MVVSRRSRYVEPVMFRRWGETYICQDILRRVKEKLPSMGSDDEMVKGLESVEGGYELRFGRVSSPRSPETRCPEMQESGNPDVQTDVTCRMTSPVGCPSSAGRGTGSVVVRRPDTAFSEGVDVADVDRAGDGDGVCREMSRLSSPASVGSDIGPTTPGDGEETGDKGREVCVCVSISLLSHMLC